VETGLYAGQTAAEAIRANDVTEQGLAAYDKRWRATIGKDMRRSLVVHDILAFFPALIDGLLLASRAVPPLLPRLLGKI
jgi:flavin-dependent dehydrogenase